MNFPEIENAVKHLLKTSKCLHCKNKYIADDVNLIATTKSEALFDMRCHECKCSTIVTVLLSPEKEINHQRITGQTRRAVGISQNSISQNDILDIKNFLNNFNGDFKKIFSKEK